MQLVKAFESCDWKGFESLIAEVLELHNYEIQHNINITINKVRRQFDVIANKGNASLVIDCKKWANKKSRVNALMKASVKHVERCAFLEKIMNRTIIPILITYNEEPIVNHEGAYIVPLYRLNDFILKL